MGAWSLIPEKTLLEVGLISCHFFCSEFYEWMIKSNNKKPNISVNVVDVINHVSVKRTDLQIPVFCKILLLPSPSAGMALKCFWSAAFLQLFLSLCTWSLYLCLSLSVYLSNVCNSRSANLLEDSLPGKVTIQCFLCLFFHPKGTWSKAITLVSQVER